MRWVHPSLVASTQGTGMGGMTSMQTMYHGNLLGRNKPNDILQEVLPNVVAPTWFSRTSAATAR